MINRRRFVGGLVSGVAGLLLPSVPAAIAAPERKVWALDGSMLEPAPKMMTIEEALADPLNRPFVPWSHYEMTWPVGAAGEFVGVSDWWKHAAPGIPAGASVRWRVQTSTDIFGQSWAFVAYDIEEVGAE